MKVVLNLGAGVQSSTLALLAAHGEVTPMPDLAIFADTGWEPAAVYSWLEWLEQRLPFPVVRVSAGNIRHDNVTARMSGHRNEGQRWSLPYFTAGPAGVGRTKRQCTADYKIYPIERYLRREVMKLKPRQRAPRTPVIEQWRGISRDEASRMKPSREPWYTVRYPLAMELGYTRHDCLSWMRRHGYPEPPRSACIGCPFHSNHEWRQMRDTRPDEWADAVDFDKAIRHAGGIERPTYLHRSCVPLDEVDLSTAEEHGQRSLFGNECHGMCGV